MQKGFIAISSILLVAAVALVIAVTVTYTSIGEGQASLALSKGEETLAFVDGCMDDALLKIRNSPVYAGGLITRPEGTCTIAVSRAGNEYTVTATTAATDYVRTIQAVVRRTGTMTIQSWSEQ